MVQLRKLRLGYGVVGVRVYSGRSRGERLCHLGQRERRGRRPYWQCSDLSCSPVVFSLYALSSHDCQHQNVGRQGGIVQSASHEQLHNSNLVSWVSGVAEWSIRGTFSIHDGLTRFWCHAPYRPRPTAIWSNCETDWLDGIDGSPERLSHSIISIAPGRLLDLGGANISLCRVGPAAKFGMTVPK